MLGGAEGGFDRVPILDAVLLKGHADVPIEGGEGELFQGDAGDGDVVVLVPFQLFQGEEVFLPVGLQLVPVGEHHPHPAAALHLGTADDEPQEAEADAAEEGAAVEVGVIAQVLVGHGDLPAA